MDKPKLLESAGKLQQVGEQATREYQDKAQVLLSKLNRQMLSRQDIEKLVGKDNLEMMQDNHANHLRFMASIFEHHNSEVLVETVLWVFKAYRSRGFTTSYWAAQLNSWINILQQELSPGSFDEILPYYIWLQINIPVFVNLSQDSLEPPFSAQ